MDVGLFLHGLFGLSVFAIVVFTLTSGGLYCYIYNVWMARVFFAAVFQLIEEYLIPISGPFRHLRLLSTYALFD